MKVKIERNAERIGLSIRADIKEAMEALRIERSQEYGNYVSLGRLFGEAAVLLLEREGVILDGAMAQPVGKPVKSVKRKRVMARAS